MNKTVSKIAKDAKHKVSKANARIRETVAKCRLTVEQQCFSFCIEQYQKAAANKTGAKISS